MSIIRTATSRINILNEELIKQSKIYPRIPQVVNELNRNILRIKAWEHILRTHGNS